MAEVGNLEMLKLEIERDRLAFEREKALQSSRLERFRIKWISGVVAVVVAVISAASGITIAALESISKQAEIDLQEKISERDGILKALEQEREFLETFASQVMDGDLNYRRAFALFVTKTVNNPDLKNGYNDYLVEIEAEIAQVRLEQDTVAGNIRKAQNADELASLKLELARLQRELSGGKDIRSTGSVFSSPELLRDFRTFLAPYKLRHFEGAEFLTSGASHSTPGSSAFGLNRPPPRELWPNIAKIAKVMDEFRERHGAPVQMISVFRTPQYAAAIGSSSGSLHLRGLAVDFKSTKGTPLEWAQILREMRDQGVFKGGIGIYNDFVHVDARGTNADWDSRQSNPTEGSQAELAQPEDP